MKVEDLKIAYIHARPLGHPIHEAYANTLNPVRFYIDYILRWHDLSKPAIIRYLSWFLCAIFFPKKSRYDVFYANGPVHFLSFMKWLGLIKKNQKLIYLIDDETLFFIRHNFYSPKIKKILCFLLSQADGFICIGDQQEKLLNDIFLNKKLYYTKLFNGVNDELYAKLGKNEPNIKSKKIVFIANVGDSDVRMFYKGIDFIPNIINGVVSPNLEF